MEKRRIKISRDGDLMLDLVNEQLHIHEDLLNQAECHLVLASLRIESIDIYIYDTTPLMKIATLLKWKCDGNVPVTYTPIESNKQLLDFMVELKPSVAPLLRKSFLLRRDPWEIFLNG